MVRLVICGDDRAVAAAVVWRCGEEWVEHIFFKIICNLFVLFLKLFVTFFFFIVSHSRNFYNAIAMTFIKQ
jgi:hypothetical protein